MSRLKMNAKMEYEYLDNFKILQKAFTKHRIQKVSMLLQAVKVLASAGYGCVGWQMSGGARELLASSAVHSASQPAALVFRAR